MDVAILDIFIFPQAKKIIVSSKIKQEVSGDGSSYFLFWIVALHIFESNIFIMHFIYSK